MRSPTHAAVFCLVVIAVFVKMFLWQWNVDWAGTYTRFNVPVMAYPGGDLRTIQVAASCVHQGYPPYGTHDCQRAAAPVTRVYPGAVVPPLNYPSIWVKAYGVFHDDSERFLGVVWLSNALLLVSAMAWVAWRINHWMLPLVLFSPITLLAVERGNTDATVFAVTVVPILLWGTPGVVGFVLGVAGALKIFPLCGLAAFVRVRPIRVEPRVLAGVALALPILVPSLLELREFIDRTPAGFTNAYGLRSLAHITSVSALRPWADVLAGGYVMVAVAAMVWAWRTTSWGAQVDRDLARLTPRNRAAVAVSLWVFVATFAFYTSWAYRLIFLVPAWCAVSKGQSVVARLMFATLCVIFWVPLFRWGWDLQNLACFALAPLATFVALRGATGVLCRT